MTLGKTIKCLRKYRGLTQAKLAKSTGSSTTSISHIEQDIHQPSAVSLELICRELSVGKSELYALLVASTIPKGFHPNLFTYVNGLIVSLHTTIDFKKWEDIVTRYNK